jgi:hypothetical protein
MNRYYPNVSDLKTPEDAHRVLKQVLDQHYALVDRVNAALPANAPASPAAPAASTSGPATTKFLGVNVAPIDTSQLANGATLKWDKVNGTFKVS